MPHGRTNHGTKPKSKTQCKLRTLDRCGATAPQVLLLAGTQPGDPGVAGRAESSVLSASGTDRGRACSAAWKTCSEPLPAERFDMSQWSRATRQHRLPHGLRWEPLQRALHFGARTRGSPLHADHGGDLPQGHPGRFSPAQSRTRANHHPEEHRPKSHQAHLEWPPSRMVNWARSIGPHTAQLFERIMNDKPHPEMGYRSCLGIIRLAQQYSPQRMEAAAERALLAQACRYQSIEVDPEELARRSSSVLPTARLPTPDRMTTSAAPTTSSEEPPHATGTDDGKTAGHAAARHGGRAESTRARSGRRAS